MNDSMDKNYPTHTPIATELNKTSLSVHQEKRSKFVQIINPGHLTMLWIKINI